MSDSHARNESSPERETLGFDLFIVVTPGLILVADLGWTYTYLWNGWMNELPACLSHFKKIISRLKSLVNVSRYLI